MLLDSSIRLEAVLGGAVATNQPEYHVEYIDTNKNGEDSFYGQERGILNSTTDVILVAIPSNPIRRIETIHFYNKDTASVTVTFKTDDGTTERILYKEVVPTLKSLTWSRMTGIWTLQS